MLIFTPEEVEGLLAMEETIAAVEKAFLEWGREPEINATRRRLHATELVLTNHQRLIRGQGDNHPY